ncbi:MAG: hypothetical protein ACRDQ2_07805 [Gaiellales bacterium]
MARKLEWRGPRFLISNDEHLLGYRGDMGLTVVTPGVRPGWR